uniref:Uncharacterized protein n=1 Tax=Caenorhabditis japonica TaxID=281687 RepID=A0A8R1E965_CAEJA
MDYAWKHFQIEYVLPIGLRAQEKWSSEGCGEKKGNVPDKTAQGV